MTQAARGLIDSFMVQNIGPISHAFNDHFSELMRHIRTVLALPEGNHIPSSIGYAGLAERYKIDMVELHDVWRSMKADERLALTEVVHPPFDPCAIEIGQLLFVICTFKRQMTLVGLRYSPRGYVLPYFSRPFDIRPRAPQLTTFYCYEGATKNGVEQMVDEAGAVLAFALAVIADHRIAITRRVLPNGNTSAQKRAALKAAQLGQPFFHHNIVELRRPETSIISSEIRAGEFLGQMPRYAVSGHWRLIDRVREPYFTWIGGHWRGLLERGLIVKTRIYSLARKEVRGFVTPGRTGVKGERVIAERAH